MFAILLVGMVFAVGNNSNNQNVSAGQVQEKNQNDSIQIRNSEQFRERIQNNEYICNCSGKEVRIKAINQTRTQIKVKNISAHSDMNFNEEINGTQTKLKAQLSNGRNAEIKIMPDTASETALARLRLRVCNETNNCTIELKEVGKENQIRVAYEIQVQKRAKVFGLFKAQMRIQTQVDAENGEIVQTNRPWWSFLASEEDEVEEEDDKLTEEEMKECEVTTDCEIVATNCCADATCGYTAVNKEYVEEWGEKLDCEGIPCVTVICDKSFVASCANNQCEAIEE